MLKRVETSELRLGMFIHKLEGSWFKHPFWKSKFLLEEMWMLEALQGSAVEAVIIDTERGLNNVPEREVAAVGAAALPPQRGMPLVPPRPAANKFAAARVATAKEFGTARKIAERHSKLVSRVFLEARLGRGISARTVDPLIDDIYASVQRNLYAFNGLLRCREDSEETYRHALATSALMIALARQMNLSVTETRDAGMAGLLMDIGANQETGGPPHPEDVWAGATTDLEADAHCQHVLAGHALLKAAGDIPDAVIKVCLRHHERLDGSGYPHRLAAPDIDQLSRMGAICDTYDLLVAGREGRPGLDPAEAIRHMGEHCDGLDPAIMVDFIEMVGIYPIGAFVELRSGRLAMVVDEDPTERALPTVYTFWSKPLAKKLKGEVIVLSQCYGADEIVGIAQLGGLDLPPLGALRQSLLGGYTRAAVA
ncbi:HD-GYP domain-containing protein [Novosphingobium sp.]|uniref:HD-GYP domain-containing protein n=1 Tax=Novosphingobium sp. TaxID=1874826 RepID=UPI002636855E|nr:HD-GYP domain-containing protein [Novosphingobium sp.]